MPTAPLAQVRVSAAAVRRTSPGWRTS